MSSWVQADSKIMCILFPEIKLYLVLVVIVFAVICLLRLPLSFHTLAITVAPTPPIVVVLAPPLVITSLTVLFLLKIVILFL